MPRTRKDIFHYALFAHALGYGSPSNPLVPRKTSGIADSGGGDLMVTLGLWDGQTGTPFVQGSTFLHELGHNLILKHGGVVPSGLIEANCKPNYQSVMNYLFQVRGLLGPAGVPSIDLSRQQLPSLTEAGLAEASGFGRRPPTSRAGTRPPPRQLHRRGLAHLTCHAAMRRYAGVGRRPGLRADRREQHHRYSARLERRRQHRGPRRAGRQLRRHLRRSVRRLDDFATLDLRAARGRPGDRQPYVQPAVVDPGDRVAPVPPAPAVGGGLHWTAAAATWGSATSVSATWASGTWASATSGSEDLGFGDLGFGDFGFGDLGVPADEALGPGDLNLETAVTRAAAARRTASARPSSATTTTMTDIRTGGATTTTTTAEAACCLAGTPRTLARRSRTRSTGFRGASVTPASLAKRVLVATLPGNVTTFTDASKLGDGDHDADDVFTWFVVATLLPPSG